MLPSGLGAFGSITGPTTAHIIDDDHLTTVHLTNTTLKPRSQLQLVYAGFNGDVTDLKQQISQPRF